MSLKRVAVFSTGWEAGMAQSVLEGEGIHAIVDDAVVDTVMPWMPTSIEGVRLLVDELDLARAAQVLADWDASTPLEEAEEGDPDNAESDEPDAEPDDQMPTDEEPR